MNNKCRKILLAAVAIIALGTTACKSDSSSDAGKPNDDGRTVYYCDRASDGTPATFGRSTRGSLALIRWESNFFTDAGYSPEKRCEIVSAKFEKYRLEGILNYITTGKENGQRVICVSRDYGGRCQGTLWTLKKDDDASDLIDQLFKVGHLSGVPPLSQSSDGSSQFYIDIDEILRKAAEKQ
ncbi:MAG: COP23 domain-containing protein [Hormoscilla sp.]